MERGYEYVKDLVVNFKLDWCCWLAPLRIGLFIIGYLNVTLAMICLIGIADESLAPLLMVVQDTIMEDHVTKPIPMIAYSAELAFNVVLLTALYRRDVKLMRGYMLWCIAEIISSIMFYSLVMAAVGAFVATTMVFSVLFQLYVLILVRSIIVQMRLEKKEQDLPVMIMSSLVKQEKEEGAVKQEKETENVEVDVEAMEVPKRSDEKRPETTRLETVDEHPKQETTNEKE